MVYQTLHKRNSYSNVYHAMMDGHYKYFLINMMYQTKWKLIKECY